MEVLSRSFDETRTKKEFKKVLWIYDFWASFTERKAVKKVIKLADVKNGNTILDVACGTGVMLKNIVKQNPEGKNIGIDISPDMIAKARKKLAKQNQNNLMLEEGNALNLNFKDNSFDILINNYMVDLMPIESFNKIASEFYRVLKPKGIIVMSTFSFGTKKIHRFWYWIAKQFPNLLTGCRPVRFEDYLVKAGFEIEKNIEISQNTFPSKIIKARKLNKTNKNIKFNNS